MDIEDRAAAAWWTWHQNIDNSHPGACEEIKPIFIDGYMAGVEQARKDYTA